MAAQLRVYPAPEADYAEPLPVVRISLKDLLPLLALARRNHYVWLQDFLDEEVSISSELYDTLQAFRACRPSA
jgi:hypothetical protein